MFLSFTSSLPFSFKPVSFLFHNKTDLGYRWVSLYVGISRLLRIEGAPIIRVLSLLTYQAWMSTSDEDHKHVYMCMWCLLPRSFFTPAHGCPQDGGTRHWLRLVRSKPWHTAEHGFLIFWCYSALSAPESDHLTNLERWRECLLQWPSNARFAMLVWVGPVEMPTQTPVFLQRELVRARRRAHAIQARWFWTGSFLWIS